MTTVTSYAAVLRDMYPRAGDRIKQWVVDEGRKLDWERDTCPRLQVDEHLDNEGARCKNVGRSQWMHVHDHACCDQCESLAERTADTPEIAKWRAERNAFPICADRSQLSDEIAPDLSMRDHPLLKSVRR